MNVFVLCTGRCGSVTFTEACHHIQNFSAGHESRAGFIGEDRLAYPEQHIEADNRLSWLLGRLDAAYGDNAAYVHLKRDPESIAASFTKRWNRGIIGAYSNKIILEGPRPDRLAICRDYCDTVAKNIDLFLQNKTNVYHVSLETIEEDFSTFWRGIGAIGDLNAALEVFSVRHNAS